MQNDDLVSAVRRALKQLDDDLGGPATHDEQARAIIPLVLEHAAGVADTKVSAIEELISDSGMITGARVAAAMTLEAFAGVIRQQAAAIRGAA